MHRIHLHDGADPAEWRDAARAALASEIAPEQIAWSVGADMPSLFGGAPELPAGKAGAGNHRVPRDFLPLAEAVLAHRDPQRHALLYRLLWRLTHGEPALLQIAGDPELARARNWEKAVKRDAHKMKAFVRFRELPAAPGEEPLFVSWFEPEHDILPRVAGFFARRFTGMRWAILTPLRSVRWDGAALHWAPGATRADPDPAPAPRRAPSRKGELALRASSRAASQRISRQAANRDSMSVRPRLMCTLAVTTWVP